MIRIANQNIKNIFMNYDFINIREINGLIKSGYINIKSNINECKQEDKDDETI